MNISPAFGEPKANRSKEYFARTTEMVTEAVVTVITLLS